MRRRLVLSVSLVALLAALTIAIQPVAAQSDSNSPRQVTFTVGLVQDLDSPNVTAGYLVSSFELWNLQFATLTDKAADDFSTIPGLATSWESSADGLTWTYKLRDGLKWSDGEPLTADDVAYTINRSRDEEWINHSATTVNLDATVIDPTTVQITSSVPDPKLPVMDVYIIPKHIFEKYSADDLTTYDALDGVGSGPFTLTSWDPGTGWTMDRNANFWGDKPAVDRVVFRVFQNPDAMVAALQSGEIDAAHLVPSSRMAELQSDPNITAVVGLQGGFTEIGFNNGAGGIGDGHPALLDRTVRQAIAHAIDKKTLLERVASGLGAEGIGLSPAADPQWELTQPTEVFDFDIAKANQMLDDAGYLDTNGDGVREMPDGSRDLTMRYAERTESEQSSAIREFVTGWLDQIGIKTEVSTYDDTQLTDVIGSGNFDIFSWGWTPFVDPDPMLSFFTCDQVTTDAADILYNDANWCNADYDALYQQQKVELDHAKRVELVKQMEQIFYEEAPYVVILKDADTQAYRNDRFEGFLQQPAGTGPVLFSNSSPSYINIRPVGSAGGGGTSATTVIVIVLIAVAVLGGAGFALSRRRATADERE